VHAKSKQFGFWQKLKGFLMGATVYSMIRDLEEKRLHVEYGFMLVVFGDMLGYPISNYYRLRLLPYWLPRVKEWKIFLLKERDVTEKLGW
jgi:hypothetical protein